MQSKRDDRFRILVVHFFSRFFDTDTISDEPILRTRLIQLLALLASISSFCFISVAIQGEVSRIPATAVFYSMIVMGLVVTFKWDSLFLDRRDYLILTPLPVSGKRLFSAKAVALCIFLAPFLIGVNIVPTFLLLAMGPSTWVGYLAAVIAASIFSVLFFASIPIFLVNVLPKNIFRKVLPPIQTISIAFLVMLVIDISLFVSAARTLVGTDSTLMDYIPPIWFLGFLEVLKFSGGAEPQAARLALKAVEALGGAAVMVTLTYSVGFWQHCKSLEDSQLSDLTPVPQTSAAKAFLQWVLWTNAAQRAAFDFLDTVSNRSPKHRISAALSSGLGLALVLTRLIVIGGTKEYPIHFSTAGLLEAPAVLSFVIVVSWRTIFGIPHELQANWIFQIANKGSAVDFRKAIRKWVFIRKVLPVFGLLAVVEVWLFNPPTAIAHLAVDLIATAFLIEALFFNFPKVPFTCEYHSNRLQIAVYGIGYLFAYNAYVLYVTSLNSWVVSSSSHMITFFITSAILFAGIFSLRVLKNAESARIIYDDPDPALQKLNLT